MLKLKSLRCVGFKRLNISKPIHFPDGRLLIFGRNESGKSTIMEAIHYALYGQGLHPHKRASNDDLINYSLSRASVELKFSIDGDMYTIRRILRRKGTNNHELIIERSDGTTQRSSGARSVNEVISQELHGIDSDALLNSCLVEQKELGKLESASRSERIHAMTSLLNLEAFVEGQQELNKAMSKLERANFETVNRLEKAEQAKKLYDQASKKIKEAQTRLTLIEQELAKHAKKIGELDIVLTAIDEIKRLDTEIKELTARLDGRQQELKRVSVVLKEAVEAEELTKNIEERLPGTRSKLEEAKLKVESLDKILNLQNQIDSTIKESERANERVVEASKRLDETKVAKERVNNLNIQIEELESAEKAQILLLRIEKSFQSFVETRTEVVRQETGEVNLQSRLEALKEVDEHITQLEQQDQNLQNTKRSLSYKRIGGFSLGVLGLTSLVATIMAPLFLVLSLSLSGIGFLFAFRNSPNTLNSQIMAIRSNRENLLGEKKRIEEYSRQLEEIQNAKKTLEKEAFKRKQELDQVLVQLPSKPRKYSDLFKPDERQPMEVLIPLRSAIQRDLQVLTRLSTERNQVEKIAQDYQQRQQTLQEEKTKHQRTLTTINNLTESRRTIEEEKEISTDQEQELRHTKDILQNNVHELEINLQNAREKASEKEHLEGEFSFIKKSIETLQTEKRERTEKKTQIQQKINIDLRLESQLRLERDQLKEKSGRFENEKKERVSDIEEGEETMKENRKLNESYPKLVQLHEKETFEIESMRRGIKLLELTRDGIVAGVKGRIETHMIRFLPSLTAQRYSMAQIDEKDYRIEVFDREARRWREKGVFSGATQDQFSLALRLAFALSTIPSSRGARPGFIFLDEPLSGFDSQRRDGLLELLRGDLSNYFDQIIVISHLEELKEEFPEQIEVESGEVVKQ